MKHLLLTLLLWVGTFTTLLAQNTVTVGSFNLEWLGHGNKERNDDDITLLATYIRALEVDVLCCQEINPFGDETEDGEADWDDLLEALGTPFQGVLSATGRSQHLGFIWRTDGVTLSDIGELRTVEREEVSEGVETFPRRPLTAWVRPVSGGPDFRLLTVHLYFGKDAARRAETTQLKDWLEDYLAGSDDEDVLIMGDFNTKALGASDTGS